jgi:hypothetical protein
LGSHHALIIIICEFRASLDGIDMCLALYLAAEIEPPLVAWNDSAPGFNVILIEEHEMDVMKHFSKPHVRYLGAHTGCSCGFAYGQIEATSEEDRLDEERARASVQALQAYLDELLRSTRAVELYACWEGEWEYPQESHRVVTTEFFGGEVFDLLQRELLVVTSHPTGP